jgi:NADH oxidase (H2O2-forming)
MAIRKRITIEDLATMENVYAPPIGAVMEPIAICAQNLLADLGRRAKASVSGPVGGDRKGAGS